MYYNYKRRKDTSSEKKKKKEERIDRLSILKFTKQYIDTAISRSFTDSKKGESKPIKVHSLYKT